MGYTKQVFEDGKILYAEELNKMSQGIFDAETKYIPISDSNLETFTTEEMVAICDAIKNKQPFAITDPAFSTAIRPGFVQLIQATDTNTFYLFTLDTHSVSNSHDKEAFVILADSSASETVYALDGKDTVKLMGSIDDLNTTEKYLVGAINEINEKTGKIKVIELADFNDPTQDELKALHDAAINHENFMICAEVGVAHPVYFTPVNIVTMNLSDDPENPEDNILVAMTIICNYGIAFGKDLPELNVPGLTSNITGFTITRTGTRYEAQMNAEIGSKKVLNISFTDPTQDELKAIYDAAMNNEVFVIASDISGSGYPVQFTPIDTLAVAPMDTVMITAIVTEGGLVASILLRIECDEGVYTPTLEQYIGDPRIGDTDLLETDAKDTLVDAINEVNGKIGDIDAILDSINGEVV